MNAAELTQQVEAAFSEVPRPAQFTDRKHCCECAEHDETLGAFEPETIGLEQLGKPGWDPICFVLPAGFLYYFPAMVRLVLDPAGADDYLEQFLFHMTYEGEESRYFRHFSEPQRRAALAVLHHLGAHKAARIEEWNLAADLDAALALWSKLAGAA